MKRENAEALLWADYRRAIDGRYYTNLQAYHPDLQALAEKLDSFLLSVDTDEGRRMTTALQLAQIINEQPAEPDVIGVRHEVWPSGTVAIELAFADGGRGVMNIGGSSIHSLSYYRDTIISEQRNRYTADTLIACDYSITTLALRHLAWLRGEYQYLQKFLTERRAAQADLPLTNP